jgi:hypothetical protein
MTGAYTSPLKLYACSGIDEDMPLPKTVTATVTVTTEQVTHALARALIDVLSVDDAKIFGRAWENSRKSARDALWLFHAWQAAAEK